MRTSQPTALRPSIVICAGSSEKVRARGAAGDCVGGERRGLIGGGEEGALTAAVRTTAAGDGAGGGGEAEAGDDAGDGGDGSTSKHVECTGDL